MKAPIMTVIGSLSFASGCLIVAANSDRLATGREFVSQTKENTSTASIFLWQILACIEIYWPLILLASASSFLIFHLAEKPLAARVSMLLPLLAVTYATWRLPRPAESDLSNYTTMGNVECICKIESRNSKNSFICRSSKMLFPGRRVLGGKVIVTIYSDSKKESTADTYKPNQTIQLFGTLSKIHQSNSSWQRNPGHKLITASVFSKIVADSTQIKLLPETNLPPNFSNTICQNWMQFWQNGRTTIIQTHEGNLGVERGALLASMVLGDRVVKLPSDLKAMFRTVGLSHLLAASGFNLSIVVATSYFCARLLPIPGYCASLTALWATASFVCLAGPSPSVVRAALLCVLFLIARLFYRRVHALAALSFTLIIALLVDPLCISDVGLQLSYVATAGIISGLRSVSRRPVEGILNRLSNWLKDTVAVICLAQLSVLPLQLLYFNTAGILFLPANLLIDPVVAPVTVIGFVSSILAFAFSQLPFGIAGSAETISLMDKLTSFALDYMIYCTAQLAKVEGSTLHFAPPVPGSIAIYYFCFMYFLYTLPNRHMRMLGSITLLIGLSLLLFRPNIPGEIIYFSKNSAMVIKDNNAKVLTGDKCDWLGKQVLGFTGCDRVSRLQSEEITTTYFDNKQQPFEASRLDLKDFTLISLKPSIRTESKKTKSSVTRKPLTWSQMNKVAANLKTKATGKPIVMWTTGKASTLRQYWDEPGLYVASVNAWSPLIISLRKLSSVKPDNKPIKQATETKPIEKDASKQELFYPFKVTHRCGDLVVLR